MRAAPSGDDTPKEAKGADLSPEGAEKTEQLMQAYRFLRERFPKGIVGRASGIPVKIGGNELNALVFIESAADLSISFFLDDAKYSRRSIELAADGRLAEDTVGVLPDFDKTDHEPDFSNMTNEEILLSAVQQLQDVPSVEKLRQGKLDSLLARMEQVRGPISVVKSEKQPNDISIEEVSLLDPESGGENGDYAHTVLVNFILVASKAMPERKLIASTLGEQEDVARVIATIENLVRANLLKRQGTSYVSNFEFARGR